MFMAISRSTSKRSAQRCRSAIAARGPRLRHTKFAIELGRWLVGECGVYLTRIVDRKVSHGRTFLITDGGMQHQLAASGNFGQVIRRNYPSPSPRFGASRKKRSPSSAASAPRSTYWPMTSCCRARTSAIWSPSSSPAPTASPRARRRSSASAGDRNARRLKALSLRHPRPRGTARQRAVPNLNFTSSHHS
jgi:hypothetical protein